MKLIDGIVDPGRPSGNTCAVSSIHAGDGVKAVQESLGHHTVALALDQYGHITEQMKKESAARMYSFDRKGDQRPIEAISGQISGQTPIANIENPGKQGLSGLI